MSRVSARRRGLVPTLLTMLMGPRPLAPTHNLTLTRTATEIVEAHEKLREALPGRKLPKLPLDASTVPTPPPKRKSTFLNTLSRLASPSSKAAARQAASSRPASTAQSSTKTSSTNTPIASPKEESADPFASFSASITNGTKIDAQSSGHFRANSTVTGLAAYFTSLANDTSVRQTRAWKRFVRVRTDDLQSARAERAIKRVRSDLAAHSSPATTEMPRSMSQVLGDAENKENGIGQIGELDEEHEDSVKEDEERTVEGTVAPSVNGANGHDAARDLDVPPQSGQADLSADTLAEDQPSTTTPAPDGEDDTGRATPVPSETASVRHSRVPRSQSADPMSRASRIYSSSSALSSTIGTASQSSITGDDSSISTTGRRSTRKKRSKSTDPNVLKKSQRKVGIDDFEMMRVLGKGCAGKVLLVRHKSTSNVYALKAITKRHVLAHQELQHTLTEQAVLKRMAAESSDPFVVRLWWSFHDKENLFLVMVSRSHKAPVTVSNCQQDFHPGGDLATQLARWGRLGRDRARFYAAEIVEGVEGLHAAGVIYRDLKPENILIAHDGHIVLTDFGLSKEFPRRQSAITAPSTPSGSRQEFLEKASPTAAPHWMKGEDSNTLINPWTGLNDTTSTFCGTAEYLAPEVIQGLPYSYEVDWWSFGTMLYEMLNGIVSSVPEHDGSCADQFVDSILGR